MSFPDGGLGLALMLGLLLVIGMAVSMSRLPRGVKALVYAALALRLAGSMGRYLMVTELYGTGDSFQYFWWGRHYATLLWEGNLQGFLDQEVWSGSKWWGTQFVRYATGVVVFLIGPSFLGGFIFYSLLAFIGLIGFGMAFQRAYPEVPVTNYVRWAWLFPSLWFWPSAIGKEAILLMGLGLCLWGFSGRGGRLHWPLLALGLFFVFAIRVQVAAVLVTAMLLAQWLSVGGRWTVGRVAQGAAILVVGLVTLQLALGHMGIEGFSADGVQGYLEENTGRGYSETRGSSIDGAAVGIRGIPVALVNILLRPFPWEARNLQMLITAVEIMAFWAIVWVRRANVLLVLRSWRSDRLLRLALSFVLVYSVTIGMLFSNMGIIARQRIFLFPFLFLLVEAVPRLLRSGSHPAGPPCEPAVALSGGGDGRVLNVSDRHGPHFQQREP
jgi:hypothetical protein